MREFFFSTEGQFRRHEFLGAILALGAAAFASGAAFWAIAGSDFVVPGFVAICTSWLAICYSSYAVCVKRLHHIGIGGRALVWMVVSPASLVVSGHDFIPPFLRAAFAVFLFGMTLFLLLCPGRSDQRPSASSPYYEDLSRH